MNEPSEQRQVVEKLAEEFVRRYRHGERPALSEYTAAHPEHAAQIRDLFPALILMEELAPGDLDSKSLSQLGAVEPARFPERVGDYRILREIGRGGMGVVYEAEQLSLGRRVALKVLTAPLGKDSRALERFRLEARSAARLHHTNIVPVFEVGQEGDLCFYAMQLIRGQGLDEAQQELRRLRKNSGLRTGEGSVTASPSTVPYEPLPVGPSSGGEAVETASAKHQDATAALPKESDLSRAESDPERYSQSVARIGVQVAEALAYAHARGVIHRDIKPSNLLLDAAGVVWVTDFGLAKTEASVVTQTGDIVGTLRYMPPERLAGQGDARADVYGLGLTLYELLVLRPAFEAVDRLQLLEQIKTQEPARPRSLDRRIPRDLETIILKAIEKDPNSRYPSAEQMAEDLRCFLSDLPIRARRASGLERAFRWLRRNPAPAVALVSAAVAFVAMTALLLGLSFTLRLSEEKARTQEAREEAEGQRDQAEKARISADRYRTQAEGLSAALALERGLALCEQGDTASGLLFLAHSLKLAPAEAADLQRDVRANLSRWQHSLHPLQIVYPHPRPIVGTALAVGRTVLATAGSDGSVCLWELATGKPLGKRLLVGDSSEGIALSPDATVLASHDGEGTVRLWRTANGEEIGKPLTTHTPLRKLLFSPDGATFLTIAKNGLVQLWEADGRKAIGAQLPGGSVAAYSPDGKTLATGDHRERAGWLWEAATGRLLAKMHTQGRVRALVFNPDGSMLLTGTETGAAELWDVPTGRALGSAGLQPFPIECLAFSPDGLTLVTGAQDGSARLFEVRTGKPIGRPMLHQGMVLNVAFSPNGQLVLTGSFDNTARLWDAVTGTPLGPPLQHGKEVSAAAFSAEGRSVVTVSSDGATRLWRVGPGRDRRTILAHTGEVWAVAFSPNGQLLATGGGDSDAGYAQLWNAITGKPVGPPLHHHGRVWAIAFDHDGKHVVTASEDETAQVWEVETGEPLGIPLRHTAPVKAVAFSRDGQTVLTGSQDGTARLWETATGLMRGDPLVRDLPPVSVARYSPDGQSLLLGRHHVVELRDAKGQIRRAFSQPDVRSAVLSPDGRTLATAGYAIVGKIYETTTGRLIGDLRHDGNWVMTVAMSPDGKTVASGGGDGKARLWDAVTGQPRGEPLPHRASVCAVAFSPDGRFVATASWDGTARLWETATGKPLGSPLQHQGWVVAVAFSPDSRTVVTASRDGTARLWEAPDLYQGPADQVVPWVQVLTGMELDEQGRVQVLDGPTWRERRLRLDALGETTIP
jgi:WD40 repeat protein/serine/threonine protein kinase